MYGFLQHAYPSIESKSFGTSPDPEEKPNMLLEETMGCLGLEYEKGPSKSWADHKSFLRSSDLIISADDSIKGFLKAHDFESSSLTDFAIDFLHNPEDPVGFTPTRFVANSAKVIHCTARLMSSALGEATGSFSVTAVTQLGLDRPIKVPENAYVIDARIKHLGESLGIPQNPVFFSEEMVNSGMLTEIIHPLKRHYAPDFEFRNPERVLLSKTWKTFVQNVSNLGPTYMVTSPSVPGVWDSNLASILAQRLLYL
jgi:hypothetical protein